MSGGGTRPGPALPSGLFSRAPPRPPPPAQGRRQCQRGGGRAQRPEGGPAPGPRGPRRVFGDASRGRRGRAAILRVSREPGGSSRCRRRCRWLPAPLSPRGRRGLWPAGASPVTARSSQRLNVQLCGKPAGLAASLLGAEVIGAFSGVGSNVFRIYNVMFEMFYSYASLGAIRILCVFWNLVTAYNRYLLKVNQSPSRRVQYLSRLN